MEREKNRKREREFSGVDDVVRRRGRRGWRSGKERRTRKGKVNG